MDLHHVIDLQNKQIHLMIVFGGVALELHQVYGDNVLGMLKAV